MIQLLVTKANLAARKKIEAAVVVIQYTIMYQPAGQNVAPGLFSLLIYAVILKFLASCAFYVCSVVMMMHEMRAVIDDGVEFGGDNVVVKCNMSCLLLYSCP